MAKEVGNPIVQILVAVCAQGGLATEELVGGLGFSLKDLSDPGSRVDWDDFTALLDRILKVCGSAAAMEAILVDGPRFMIKSDRDLGAFPDLKTFFLWMISSPVRMFHTNLQTTTRLGANGTVLCEYHIPHPYRPCRALAIASKALFQGVPRLFGLPDAKVSCAFDERSALYLVDLPSSPVPWSSLVSSPCAQPSSVEAYRPVVRHIVGDVTKSPWLVTLGRDLLNASTPQELGQQLGRGLRLHGGCAAGRIWIRNHDGNLEQVHSWGPEFIATECRMLTMGARILGRIEVDVFLALEGQAQQELLSWACIALEHLLDGPASCGVKEIHSEGMHLTPRLRQVLFLLVQGLSDKEIAQSLGTSPKTVGHQVGELLRKGGVASRTALANRCLSSFREPTL